jgi:spore maturation protein CgeB
LNGKEIDVSFLGPLEKGERQAYVDAYPDILTSGGVAKQRIPLDDYAELLRTSKLSLNVPEVRKGIDQFTGRAFEIAFSRTALMQPIGPTIQRFLEPGREFIPLEGPDEFPKKVRYYLEHEAEREEIAAQGWKRVTQQYTAQAFWDAVRGRL